MNKAKKTKADKNKGKLLTPADNLTHADDSTIDELRSLRAASEASFAIQPKKIQYENTYRLEPETRFKPYEIEGTALEVFRKHLENKTYDPEMGRKECQLIATKISEALKAKNFKRYKHVVIVSIGSIKERPGVYLGSRCLWNDKTDSFATVRFENTSMYALAMIYGLYYE